jgi:hypothetical protein
VCEKWSRYLALKSKFYKAQAYCYFGQDLLAQDKCGDAIKCLEESRKRMIFFNLIKKINILIN